MSILDKFVDDVIQGALDTLGGSDQGPSNIVTFALYYDHESPAVSVCADTLESSRRSVASLNAFNETYFLKAIAAGDLEDASLWSSNTGRSLALGDFAHVNLCRKKVGIRMRHNGLFVAMAKGLIRNTRPIFEVCDTKEQIVFATSTAKSEVGLVWCPSPVV